MSSTSLDKYCCIALSGVATEFLLYGQSEGGLNDVQQLDALLRALQARSFLLHQKKRILGKDWQLSGASQPMLCKADKQTNVSSGVLSGCR